MTTKQIPENELKLLKYLENVRLREREVQEFAKSYHQTQPGAKKLEKGKKTNPSLSL